MKEECYAALGHILTCNKNKEPQMHEVVKWRDTERERERERERESNSNHQSSTPIEHLPNA